MIEYNRKNSYLRPNFDEVTILLKKVPNTSCDKVSCHNDTLYFWIANLDQASMCCGFNAETFNQLLNKYNLDISKWLKLSEQELLEKQGLNREQTKERVFEMLSEVITKDSKMTKGSLIKYIRENFNEQTVYSDVGKVASKVINEKTGNSFSKWQVCTAQRHIRSVK